MGESVFENGFQIGQILQVTQDLQQNRYRLVEPLKINGLRQTWRSINLTNQQFCVIKLLAFHGALQWQDYEQFEQEIKVLRCLKSDRIPRYLSHFSLQIAGIHWVAFVQEEIPGRSLQALLNDYERFSEAEIRQIAIELLQILIDLHEQYPPILHRNINPSKVILTSDRSVYLVDFGAAGTPKIGVAASHPDIHATCINSSVPGTDGYVAPEQIYGQALPASDLYAVGTTLVYLLTGICPADLLEDSQNPQLQQLVGIDDRFLKWLSKMLEPDVNLRFQAARQAFTALLSDECLMLLDNQSKDQLDDQSKKSLIQFTPGTSQTAVSASFNHNPDVQVRSSPLLARDISQRIKVSTLSDRLQINIGRRGVRLADVLWLGAGALTGSVSVMMLFSHVHPALSVLCWLDSLPLFGIGLISALGEAVMTIDSSPAFPTTPAIEAANASQQNPASFSVQWKCLGIPYRRIRSLGAIVSIQSSLPAEGNSSAASGITIQTENRQYSIGQFSPPLSQGEAEWIADWVDGWMGEG